MGKKLSAKVSLSLGLMALVSVSPSQTTRAQQQRPNLDEEAQAIGRQVTMRRVQKCGASYYGYKLNTTAIDVRISSLSFSEFRLLDPSKVYCSQRYSPSPAQRLNGLEWDGECRPPNGAVWRTRVVPQGLFTRAPQSDVSWWPWPDKWDDFDATAAALQNLKNKSRSWLATILSSTKWSWQSIQQSCLSCFGC